MSVDFERKVVRLHAAGASRSAVLPARWLRRHGIEEQVLLTETDAGILITAPSDPSDSIEAEPEFARFLDHLAKDALRRPERLVDPAARIERGRELVRRVASE